MRFLRLVRAPPAHHWVRSYVTDTQTNWIDDLARKSPTALAMALERAIGNGDRGLERAVLTALAKLGIIVVDRTQLVDTLADAKGGGIGFRTSTEVKS